MNYCNKIIAKIVAKLLPSNFFLCCLNLISTHEKTKNCIPHASQSATSILHGLILTVFSNLKPHSKVKSYAIVVLVLGKSIRGNGIVVIETPKKINP